MFLFCRKYYDYDMDKWYNTETEGMVYLTVRERVLASRLIQKIETQSNYAKRIGLECRVISVKTKDSTEDEKGD